MSDFDLTVSSTQKSSISIGGEFEFTVKVECINPKKLFQLEGGYIIASADPCWNPKKVMTRPVRAQDLECTMSPRPKVTIADLPEYITLKLKTEAGQDLASINVFYPVSFYCEKFFLLPKKVPRLNLMLFGRPGSSKSTFINSVYSMLSGKRQEQVAVSGGDSDHVTEEVRPYRLANMETGKAANVILIDTWGVTDSSYEDGQFSLFCKGKIQMGTSKDDTIDVGSCSSSKLVPHCILFFIPAADILSRDDMVSNIAKYISRAQVRHGVRSMVVLSMVDDCYENFSSKPFPFSPEIEGLITQASEKLSVSKSSIAVLENYHHGKDSNFLTDKVLFNVLETAYMLALGNAQEKLVSEWDF